jgi:hypothetical protein
LALGKAFFAECFLFGSRQSFFTERPKKNTRQSLRRSAKKRIPIVRGVGKGVQHDGRRGSHRWETRRVWENVWGRDLKREEEINRRRK